MSQLNAWNEHPDPETWEYHTKQWNEPYRSTVKFEEFIKEKLDASELVIDAGCGSGAPTHYLAESHPTTKFMGIEISRELLGFTKTRDNLEFERDDLTNLKVRFGVDGVVLIQVLSWLPGYETALHQIATRIRPHWIAFSTLIWPGDIDCNIVVKEHKRPRESFHNIYGLPGLMRFMTAEGYPIGQYKPFNIDIEIPQEGTDHMKSYTSDGELFSGPLFLPWAFVMFERAG